jgi:hypothetical protein
MNRTKRISGTVGALVLSLMAGSAAAQADGESPGFFSSLFSDMDFSIGGFIRPEFAYSLSSKDNWANQLGNEFNGRSIPRQAYLPPAFLAPNWDTLPFPVPLPDVASPGLRGVESWNNSGTPFEKVDNDYNYSIVRAEVETGLRFSSNLTLIARVRAIYDPTIYDDFDAGDVSTLRGGISGGDPALYAGAPNYFDYRVEGDNTPNPLEWAGKDYLVYFPTLLLEYNTGAVTARIGNQQIAWGQALFFRVFDVVDGLDLRRHLVLDYAQEEYADERVPSLGLRLSYQISDEWLADGYVQKFQPTVYGNPNTQYNVIPVQFTVHDLYAQGGYDEELNYGLRFKGNYGQWGFQAMAVQRYNPDGVFRWTESGVNKPLPGGLLNLNLGSVVNIAYAAKLPYSGVGDCNPTLCRLYGDIGEALSHTPFEASPGGVYSANEWYNYAAQVRLDGINGLNASIDEFPASQDVYASHVNTYQEGFNQLNTFFIAAGGSLRGHIAREYFQEEVFGLGVSYVTEGEPGGIFDQLIINLEASYTPDRTFTNTTLSRNYITDDSIITALVLEKYYRFSQYFPATYFVFQHMYRSVDDLFGRHLSGYGGSETSIPSGVDGAHYIAFAFQQPFPQDVFRIGFATLYDPRGSILVQPGIKWKPRGYLTVEAFYSYLDGSIGNVNANETLLSTVDYADEVTLRVAYQF